jgi:uncharacterized protein YukE
MTKKTIPLHQLTHVETCQSHQSVHQMQAPQCPAAQAIAAMPPLKPHRMNAWHVTLQDELLSPATVPTTTTQKAEPTQEQTLLSPSNSVTDMSQISMLTEENSALKKELLEKSNELEAMQGTLKPQIAELQATRLPDVQEATTKANMTHAADTLQLKGTITELQNTLQKSNELAEGIQEKLIQSQMQHQHTMEKLETINKSHFIQ